MKVIFGSATAGHMFEAMVRSQPAADIGVTTVRTAAIAAVGLRRANSRFQQRLSRLANDLTVAESARCFNKQRA